MWTVRETNPTSPNIEIETGRMKIHERRGNDATRPSTIAIQLKDCAAQWKRNRKIVAHRENSRMPRSTLTENDLL